jgi:hypothetical protein
MSEPQVPALFRSLNWLTAEKRAWHRDPKLENFFAGNESFGFIIYNIVNK